MLRRSPRLPTELPALTDRQKEVLDLLARGRTNFEIAQALGLSLEGAKYHVREILQRLNVDTREEAGALWRARQSPRRRVSRMASGLFGAISARWVAGVTVTLCALGGGAVVAALLAGSEPDPPAAGPTSPADATSTPAGTGQPGLTAPVASPTRTSVPGTPVGLAGPTQTALPVSPTPGQAAISPTLLPPTPPAPTPLPPTPPPAGPYPLGTRTGDTLIDQVIAAVEAGDPNALFALIHYAPVGCNNFGEMPAPPGTFQCPNGEPTGTGIPAVRGEGVEGWVVREGDDPQVSTLIHAFLVNPFTPLDPRLHAIVNVDPNLSPGERMLVFASGQALIVDGEGITHFLAGGMGLPATRITTATGYLLPPPPPPQAQAYAVEVRESLFTIASQAAGAGALTEDVTTGFGLIPAWYAAMPGLPIIVDGTPVTGDTVSIYTSRLRNVPQPGDYQTNPGLVTFAIAGAAGECVGGAILVYPQAGFITQQTAAPAPGAPCTSGDVAEAVRAR